MTGHKTDPRWEELERLRREVAELRDVEERLQQEIAERQRLETAVAAGETRIRRMFENASIGIALVGLDEQIIEVNQTLCDILGYDKETLLTKTIPDITHPDDIAVEAQYKADSKEGQFDSFWLVKRYIHADGRIIWGRLSVSTVTGDEGTPLYFIGQLEDITRRKQAEESLLASETRFRMLIEQSSLSIIIYDRNGRILMANPASKQLWRLSPEDFANLAANYSVLEDEVLAQSGLLKQIKQAFAGEAVTIPATAMTLQNYSYEEATTQKLWIAAYAYPVKDELGHVQEVVVMHEDVTERVLAEEALRQSESLHRTLVQTIPYGVQEADRDGRVTFVNPSLCRTLGYTEDELIGRHIWDLLPDETAQKKLRKMLQHIHENHPQPETYFATAQTKDGRLIQTQSDWDYRRDADGTITGTVAIITDITARKRTEERLQNYNQRLQIVQEVAQAILAAQSPEAIANAALIRIQQTIPFSRSSLVLFDFATNEGFILAVLDQQPTKIQAGMRRPLPEFDIEGRLFAGEPVVRNRLSSMFPDLVWRLQEEGIHTYLAVPLMVQGQLMGALYMAARELVTYSDHYVETLREIAEFLAIAIQQARLLEQVQQHAAELEERVAERTHDLTQANARLLELDRLKTKFISDITHELRTPVTNLLLYLDLIRFGPSENVARYQQVLYAQVERLQKLVADSLDLSRLDFVQEHVQSGPLDLNPIIDRAVASVAENAAEKGLGLSFSPKMGLPLVLGDADKLGRMIESLLVNALNFTPAGAVQVRTLAHETADLVGFQVQDTGIGFTVEDQKHLFEPFYRGERVGQFNIPGNGLGLALVKRIVDLHNGRIEIESVVDQGSTITVWLPIAPENISST